MNSFVIVGMRSVWAIATLDWNVRASDYIAYRHKVMHSIHWVADSTTSAGEYSFENDPLDIWYPSNKSTESSL